MFGLDREIDTRVREEVSSAVERLGHITVSEWAAQDASLNTISPSLPAVWKAAHRLRELCSHGSPAANSNFLGACLYTCWIFRIYATNIQDKQY